MRFNTLDDWLKWQESFHPKEIDLGLERVRKVYQYLNPRKTEPFTITVAGTNGKGSCVAMLNTILRTEGYRVGAYTSPHLLKYNERIQIQGQPVADQIVCEAFDRVDQVRQNISLSYFEFGTLAALDIFTRSRLDVQLLEVGLGGRLDAVNIVDTDIALVTSIAIDHSDWLGESRESIGLEKAGIFRPEVLAIIGDPNPPDSLLRYAQQNDVPLSRIGREFSFQRVGQEWNWYGENQAMENLPLPSLRGSHQLANAAVVLQTLQLIKGKKPISENSIKQGLSKVYLPGRFQTVLNDKAEILLDVAHNPQAATALADNLGQTFPGRRIHAVFSIMGDKDIEGVLLSMKNVVNHWYVASLDMPRAASESDIVKAFKTCCILPFDYGFKDIRAVLEAVKQNCEENDLIVIFGSFFLVAHYLGAV